MQVLRVAAAILLFGILLYLVDWRESATILLNADVGFVLYSFLMGMLGLVISALRWHVLLAAQQVRISSWQAISYYWIGAFFSNYLPSNIGGDVARAMLMRRTDRLAQVAASIVAERVSGMFVLLLMVIAGLVYRPQYFDVGGLLQILWIAVAIMMSGAVLIMPLGPWMSGLLVHLTSRLPGLLAKILDKVRKLVDAMNRYRDKPGATALGVLIAVPFYATLVLFHYFVLHAVGGDIPLLEVLMVAALVPLVSFLPISINAFGIAEGAFVLIYTQAGLSSETALAGAVLHRLVLMFVSLFGGLFWLGDRQTPPVSSA
jgi:uncharacterized protein (TIRG00374 family)